MTDTHERSARPRRLAAVGRPSLALLVALVVASAGCRDTTDKPAANAANVTPGATSAVTHREAVMLPLTPVSSAYHTVDPSFQPLTGARALSGLYDGGAYRIEVPDRWNGDVVYYAHGFRGNPPELSVEPPPLRQHLIDLGYAWAASSYSKNGYEPGAGARDTYALREIFAREAGAPRRSYLYGQSMGGHVAAFMLEQYPTAYDGALVECGVVSGHEILDYFLSWGAVAGYLSDTDLGAYVTDSETMGTVISGRVLPALGPPATPTERGRAFASVMRNLTGGARPYFEEGFRASYGFNFAVLVLAASASGPANSAAQNADIDYAIDPGLFVTSDTLNAEVARVRANDLYRDPARYPEFANFSGAIQRPLLTIHNTGDMLVPISLEQKYRRTVEAAGSGDFLVQRAVRREGHCNFTPAERERAFDDLAHWVSDGVRPAGEDLSGNLRDVGRAFTLPLAADDPGGLEQ